jgi:molybdopterin converting factor small subunit
MVKVVLWGSLRAAAGGAAEVEVEARNVRQLLDAIGEVHPGLKGRFEGGVTISIDGQIYRDAWFQEIAPDSEVYLLPYLQGG